MVSEMLPSLNWEDVGAHLIDASKLSGAMLHVLDLRELRMLVGISKNNPELFAAYLAHRFDLLVKHKNAMIRTTFGETPTDGESND